MQHYISDEAFEAMYGYLRSERAIHCGDKDSIRTFLEAIYWLTRSGAQWRLLPQEYGRWNSVYKRYERWSALGVWKRMFHYFSTDADLEWLMIDSTIVRAHACTSGAKGGESFRRSDAARAVIAAKYTLA